MNINVLTYHRSLFQWHCRNFFNFRRHLSVTEKAYLEKCFSIATKSDQVSEGGYEHFSYYTYSHRVKGESVNSSRMAYGSVDHPDVAFTAAQPVLHERGLILPQGLAEHPFYGLGWDIEDELFKVYFRTLDWRELPPLLAELVVDYNWNDHRPEALLSLTFQQNQLIERKIYLYPKDEDTPEGTLGRALMITDTRGVVTQSDLSPSREIPYDLNEIGQKILAAYQEIGEGLDTIAYEAKDNYTLYFP